MTGVHDSIIKMSASTLLFFIENQRIFSLYSDACAVSGCRTVTYCIWNKYSNKKHIMVKFAVELSD